MGGAASVLSSEDFVTMSQNLKEEYEVLITSGYTDDEIRNKLMEKYNELFVTSEPNNLEAASSGGETDSSAILVIAGTSWGLQEDIEVRSFYYNCIRHLTPFFFRNSN